MNMRFFCLAVFLLAFASGCGRDEPSTTVKGEPQDAPTVSRLKDPEYRKALDERTDGRLKIEAELTSLLKELKAEQEKDATSEKVKELEEKLRQLESKATEYRRETQRIIAERIRAEGSEAGAAAQK